MRVASATLVLALCAISASEATHFPLYKQCDPSWGSNQMGVPGKGAEDDTVCHQGCAMSCVAMALAGHGISVPSQPNASQIPSVGKAPLQVKGDVVPTPGSLNAWLRATGGYQCLPINPTQIDCCNLVLSAPAKLAPERFKSLGEPPVPFLHTLKEWVQNEQLVVIAHVRKQTHFVLLTGGMRGSDEFEVNDPGFNQTHYSYSEIHDVLLFNVLPL